MKKNTFYAIAFLGMLTGCTLIEGYGSNSAEITAQEQNSIKTMHEENVQAYTDSEITEELKKLNPSATSDEIEDLIFANGSEEADYIIILDHDSLRVKDPETGNVIFTGSWDDKTALNEAIFKDNL